MLALGRIGRALLALYTQYSLIINPLVLLYGTVSIYAHSNLRKAVRQIEDTLLEIAQPMGDQPDHRQVHQQLAERWKVAQGTKRLFLPSRGDLWFGFLDGAELIEALHIGPDYVRMALHKRNNWPRQTDFHPVDYRVWEEYRHRLLIGVRVKLPDIKALKARYREQQSKKAKERGRRKK